MNIKIIERVLVFVQLCNPKRKRGTVLPLAHASGYKCCFSRSSKETIPGQLQAIYLLVCALLILGSLGCSRTYYRKQADAEAYCVINHKAACVDAEPGSYGIQTDPRSRMYDPYNPDCEPMPPDDPTSNKLLQCVDCKKGSECWRCLPKTPFVDNPDWLAYLPRNERGEVVLDMHGAVGMALMHSPSYQSELEDLYLSALDVTFERFRFDTQFFGGSSVFYTADGRDRSGSGEAESELSVAPFRAGAPANSGNRLRASRLTATGGELVVGLANSLVWQFAGPNDYSSNTVLDFSIVQPLLRTAGRARVLERLTITERALLSNVRQMERYRRNFYLSIVTGRDAGQGPSRRGGVFGGSGLEGFTGVGGSGFGQVNVGGNFVGGGTGGGFTGGAGAQGAGGYLGLLQTALVLRNQRNNVTALRDSVEQLQASYEADRIDRFQVDLARQALYNSQSQLLSSEASYQSTLDNFKVSIGLPPELELKIEDPMLDRLNLLDPELDELQLKVTDELDELRTLRTELVEGQPNDAAAHAERLQEELHPALVKLDRLLAEVDLRVAVVHHDFEQLDEALPQRREYLERLANRDEAREANIDPSLFSAAALDERIEARKSEFAAIEGRMEGTRRELAIMPQQPPTDVEGLGRLIDTLSDLSGQLLELSLVQASARLEAVTFSPVDLTDQQALAIAATYRRDWMNARASLVDSWRLIYFNANDLLSDVDLVFSGDLGNVGDNPFDLRDSRGRLRVGVEFDAPLTRLSERNTYRQALIEYQQARRNYYQYRDRIYQSLRSTLRQIRLNELNFELRRAAVQVAISQVDLTQLRLSEPPQPGATEQFNNTTARDLVQSLSDLLNVQNDFLSVWVNYEVQRLGLESDLGVMELMPNGQRIENETPWEMYLAGVSLRPTDLGLAAKGLVIPHSVEVIERPEGSIEAEPIPVPVPEEAQSDESARNFRRDENVQVVAAYRDLLPENPVHQEQTQMQPPTVDPVPLPKVE